MNDELHSVFHDFDGFLGGLDEADNQNLTSSFNRATDPDSEKKVYANQRYLVERGGIDPARASNEWPVLRRQLGRNFGLDGDFNEEELHHALANSLQEEKSETEFLGKVAQRGISDALTKGGDVNEAFFNASQELYEANGNQWKTGQLPRVSKLYRQTFERAAARSREFQEEFPDAGQTVSPAFRAAAEKAGKKLKPEDDTVQSILDTEAIQSDPREATRFIRMVSRLDPEEQGIFISAVAASAEATPRDYLGKVLESARRGGIDIAGNLAQRTTQVQAAKEIETGEKSGFRDVSPEIRIREADTQRYFRDIVDGVIDPLESSNRFANGIIDFARSAPHSAATLAATAANPIAGLAVAAQLNTDSRYAQLRREEPELSPIDAERIAISQGLTDAVIEVASDRITLGTVPRMSAAIARIKNTAGRASLRFASVSGSEVLEELVQDTTAAAIKEVLTALDQDLPGFNFIGKYGTVLPDNDFKEDFDKIWNVETGLDTFFATLPMAIFGVAGSEGARVLNPDFVANIPPRLNVKKYIQERELELQQESGSIERSQAAPEAPTVRQTADGVEVVRPDGVAIPVENVDEAATVVREIEAVAEADLFANSSQAPALVDDIVVQSQGTLPVTKNYGPGASSVGEWRERNFSRRFVDDPEVSSETRDLLPDQDNYLPITNLDTVEKASALIEEQGVVATANQLMDRADDLTFANKITTGQLVLKKIEAEIETLTAARAAGQSIDQDDIFQLADLSSDLEMDIAALGTELGQGIQAFSMWARLTPDGTLRKIERALKTRRDKEGVSKPEGEFTPEQKEKIKKISKEITDAPDGFIRADKVRKLNAVVARSTGIPATDVLTSLWYANVLSGPTTQTINFFGSGMNLLARGSAAAVADPKGSGAFLQGLYQGISAGLVEAKTILGGKQVVRGEIKFEGKIVPLEDLFTADPKNAKERFKNILAFARFVPRFMMATDGFFYRTAYEGRAYLAADRVARKTAASPQERARLFNEALSGGETKAAEAMAQAREDVKLLDSANETDVARRAYEILDFSRDEVVRQEADRFGKFTTFTQEPAGVMGEMANVINNMHANSTFQTRFGEISVTRPLVPFVNIVANVVSNGLDFTPIGLARAAKGSNLVGKNNSGFTREERIERGVMALIGTSATTAVYQIAAAFIDDDDPSFMITAEGPQGNLRKTLMSTGWKPYTIKMGDTYIKYNETPLGIPFAFIGGLLDAQRYRKSFGRFTTTERIAHAATLMSRSVIESGFLSSVSDVFDLLNGDGNAANFVIRTSKGFTPAQGLLRDIAKFTDPEIADSKTAGIWGQYMKDIPFAQGNATQPLLNGFGEPVTRDFLEANPLTARFFSLKKDDPDWAFVAEKGLNLKSAPESVTVASPTNRQKRQIEQVKLDREKDLGRAWAGVLTAEERYQFMEIAGPQMRELVKRLRETGSDLDSETLQAQIDREWRRISKRTKLQMLGL